MITPSRTKIICTIGPKSCCKAVIKQLMQEGMSVARLNFSHGTREEHLSAIKNIREASEELNMIVGIALDTSGPELRINTPGNKNMNIVKGEKYRFCTEEPEETAIKISRFAITNLLEGDIVLIDDGKLRLKVLTLGESAFDCLSLNDHVLESGKGVNIPGKGLGLPFVTDKDVDDINFGIRNGVDFIFASFVNSKEDVLLLRKLIKVDIPIISKIETSIAMTHLKEIVEVSDGVMVARGDLGAEIGLEKLFQAQKQIFVECRNMSKPFICATQMMESMCKNKAPTRAEISDVGNAVLDGCDCVMLSSETASGQNPALTVSYMRKVCLNAEEFDLSIAHSTYNEQLKKIEDQLDISNTSVIVVVTESMSVLQQFMAFSFIPMILVSKNTNLLRLVTLLRGIHPVYGHISASMEDEKLYAEIARRLGFVGTGLKASSSNDSSTKLECFSIN